MRRAALEILLSSLAHSAALLAQSPPSAQAAGLEHCDSPIGVVAVVEPQDAVQQALTKFKLESPTQLIRVIIQQSNCFKVVERGMAMQNVMQERSLAQSGQLRQGSDVGGGQLVAADFLLTPTVTFSEGNAGGVGGLLAGITRVVNPVAGMIAGGLKFKEAETSMLLADARSGLQVAAAQGHARKTDFGFGGLGLTSSALAGLGAYTNTNEGKVIAASFIDNFNNVVRAVRADSSLQRHTETVQQAAPAQSDALASVQEGDVLIPKIAGIKLLSQPRDSSKPVATLGKTDEVVFLGTERNGFLNIQGAAGAGWVKKILVEKRR